MVFNTSKISKNVPTVRDEVLALPYEESRFPSCMVGMSQIGKVLQADQECYSGNNRICNPTSL